ncbi:MAG: hypothetical protein JO222_06285, partial [Frankiales bacterium]|nr:hypothetical protein [Frankiales bacterium]
VTDAAGNTRSDTFDYTYDGTLTTPTVSRARAVDVSSAPSFAVTGVDPDVVSVSCAVSAGATVTSCTSSGVGISVTGGDGTYTVSVTVTDAAGNTRTGTFDYTLDTTLTKPTVSRAKALDHLTSPSFTVAGVDPDVVSVSCTVSAGATVTSCTATGVTIAITGSDGTYTVSVTVTDGAGNTKTGTFDYTLDTALTKPAVSRAKALDKDSTPSFTVSGVDPDVVSVTCTVSAGATVTACSSSGVSISVTGGDGTYTVSVTVTDAAGNTKTGTFAYTLDTTLTKPTVSRPKALDRVSSPSFAVTGVDPDVVSVSCTVSAGATVTSCTSSGVSISVTGGDGTYTVSVTVTDAAGNTKTGTFAYTLDTALTSPTLSRAKALDKDPTPSFTVSGVDPDVVSVTCAVSAGATVTSCTSSGVNLSVTGGDGTYTVSVTVTDAAGNTRTGTFDYTLDTTLTKPTVSRAKATDNNASPSFTVSGVDPDVVSVTCTVSAGATVTSCTSSAVSLSVTGGDGTYTVSVTVTDAAGNTKTGTFDYTLDTTLATPTVSRLKALDNNTAPTFAVGGVDPDVVSVSCTVTAGATVTACSATSTRISITGGDGTYTVTVTVTDAAGNTRSGTFDYTLDTALTKPTLSRAKSLDNDPAPSFTVGGVDPDVVSVSCAVSAGATVTSCTSSGVNVSITGGDGTYTVTVTVTDAAGNTKSGTFDYTLDRTLSQPTVARPKALDHNTTPSFGVSGIDPDVVSITCSVSAGATLTACTATKVTISITGSDGPYVVSVVVTDAAGNTKTGTFTYTLDTTLTTPTVAGATLGNFRAPAFSVSGVDGDVVSVTCTVSGAGNTVSACTASGVTINLSLAADGTYTVTVTVRDAAGNVRTGSFDYTLDTTLTTPVVTRAKAVDNTANPAFTVGGVDPDVVTVSCSVTGGATVTACTSTGVTLDITGGDGSYTVTVTVTDAAGNTRSGNFTYTYDTTLTTPTVSRAKALDHNTTPSFVVSGVDPDVTSVTCTVSAGATVTSCSAASARISITGGDGTYTISVTVTDAAGNTRTGTFAYTLDTTLATPVLSRPKSLDKATAPSFTISGVDPDVVSVSCAVTGAGATVSSCTAVGVTIDLSGAADGVHTVSVTVTDAAGNTRTATFAYTLDTTLTTPTVSRAKSIDNNTGPSFAVSGVDSDVVSVSCAVTGTGAQVTACSASGVTLDLTAAGDGTYTVSVTVTDAAGNVRTGTFDYTLDTGLSTPTVTRGRALDNATAPSFTVSGVDPDVVSVTCAVTGVGTRVTSCTSTGVTLDLSAAADGTYTVTVTVRDVAGNVRSASFDYTLDTTLTRPTISRAKAIDNDSAPAFTVSGVDPDVVTVACSVSAGATVSSCTASGVALSITGGDGSYTVTVNVTDAAGNVRTASFAYTLDTTLSTPAVTRPRALDNATSPTFTVSGVDPDVVTVTCAVTGTGSRVSSCTATGVTLDLTSAADGVYTVTVTVTDRAGNVRSASFDYTLDTTLTTPTISRAKTTDNTTTPIFAVSGVDPDVVSVTCTASAGAAVTSCTATGVALSISGSDGSYTVTVTVRDRAGNIRTTSLSYTLDTTLTTPTVTRARALDNTTTPTFAVGSVDPDVASVSCTVTGVATVTSCTATGVTLSITGPDDVYVVTVTVTDNAGNVRSASFNYTLDTTLTTPTISRGKALDKNPTPTFGVAGVDADVTSLTCAATGGARVVSCSATGASLDLTGLADGTYALSVTVRDAAGNVRTATFNYTLDTVGPAAPGVGTPPTPGNDRTPTLTFSTEPGATLTCTIERYFQPVSSGPCPADGTLDLSGLADGEFEITVVATDAAGNVGQSTTVVYVLDTVAPDAAVITAPASPSPIETPTWIWTAEPGATAVCTVTNAAGAVVIGPVACTSPFVANLRALPDGNYTLTVVVTDAAGNNSAPARSDFDLDRTAPVPPTVVPPRSPDNSPTPRWIITGPRGALLTCTLLRGRKVIWGPAACPANGVFSLAGLPDGTYTLRVTATDRAGNVSAESVSTYVFDTTSPATPRLDYHSPTPSTNTSPFWGFTLPNGTMGRCQLWHDGTVIATKSCKGAVTFDLSGRPHGTYTVRIVAIDAAGNLSSPLVVTYQLGTKPSNGGGGPPPPPPSGPTTPGTGGHHGGGHHPRQPSSPGVVQQTINRINQLGRIARSGVKHAVQSVIPEAAGLLPAIHDRFTENVTSAVQGVVNAVSHAGGGTGFPLLLLFVVLLFLIMQNRIDRRDPKLALASVAADDTVEFLPPPSRGADR